jgi:hypothetical protein
MTLSTPTIEGSRRSGPGSRQRGRTLLAVTAFLLVAGGLATWGLWHGSIGPIPVRSHCTATVSGSTTSLTPEQAGNAAIIAGVAVRRGLPARAATIGVATAMQESKLVNLSTGDRDSLGLFQQRPSQGWGTAARIHDPVYATNAFYDVLIEVTGYESLPVTEAAQKVQRSAFPSAYADHEPEARLWASTLTGHTEAGLTCVLADVTQRARDDGPGADRLTSRARAVKAAARAELGRNVVPSGTSGKVLRFGAAPSQPHRLAWAVAQWAVARAEGLRIVRVEVDGMRWDRGRSARGWEPAKDGPRAGEVLLHVA